MKRFLIALLACSSLFAAEPPAKEKFHLFLLVGQSNMAGRGIVEAQDTTPHPRVLTFNKTSQWVPAVDPLHWDKAAAGVGLGKTFGQILADADPSVTIGLIPCAVGGSPIDTWKPGGYHEQTKSHPWDDAIPRALAAMKSGTLKGILWHQGESDSLPNLAPTYEAKLHDLIARFRSTLAAPDVPFIAGQMGIFADAPWPPEKTMVAKVHRDLPTKVKNTAFVPADGLKHKGDKVHFDAASYRELGKRYAKVYLEIIKAAAKPGRP